MIPPTTQRSYSASINDQLVCLNYSRSPMCSQQVYENAAKLKPKQDEAASVKTEMKAKVVYLAFTLKFNAKLVVILTFLLTNRNSHTKCLWG